MQVWNSDHIVAQQANRYIVAFHIAILYDTQRPPYKGRAVGLPPTHCMYGLTWRTTVRADQCTAACETHWMRRVSRRWRVRLMFDVQGQSQCAAETGTINDVFTGSARRRHGLTWAGAWWPDWCHVTLTRTHAAAGGCQSEWRLDRRCSVDIITTLTLCGTTSTVGLSARIV